MVAREPGEFGGEYYRLIPEGTLKNWDGLTVKVNPDRGLDLNRNFPANGARSSSRSAPAPTRPASRGARDGRLHHRHPNIGAASAITRTAA
jgi:hypothetical protein